ncbi:hypothetical protein STIUS_v1c06310 [Spiroplasma sp. TIUS-1]|uniref:hypothetical protein n=1 Tax=Spiroplasma sp. TIUS-1 TaxID=216963 RepID=UPI001398DC9B|nr:hypothetical protein [Spiroplasma sp. TIUS-1]QHX36185.1 hypothetical protein STIUS_v1c06310 [Spiroplasma sp. TIUS-1]
MRSIENNINNFVDNFITSIIGKIDLGSVDTFINNAMIIGSAIFIFVTLMTLVLYKFFHKKKVRVAVYTLFSLWSVITLLITFLLIALSYNWFHILDPLNSTIDPILDTFREIVKTSGETGINFFNGMIGGIFGSGMNYQTLSTQSVIKFILNIPMIIAWVNIGLIFLITLAIIFAPKFEFIKLSVQVAYFMFFIVMLFFGIWFLIFSINANVKTATILTVFIKGQAHIITGGIISGIENIKDKAEEFVDGILGKINDGNLEEIVNQIINTEGGVISIMGDEIKIDISELSGLLGIDQEEIINSINEFKDNFVNEGSEKAKESLTQIKDWLSKDLK